MTGEQLANVLTAGARGIEATEALLTPEVSAWLVRILTLLKDRNGIYTVQAMLTANVDGEQVLNKLIDMIQRVDLANQDGSLQALDSTMLWLTERKRLLKFIGRFIKDRSDVEEYSREVAAGGVFEDITRSEIDGILVELMSA